MAKKTAKKTSARRTKKAATNGGARRRWTDETKLSFGKENPNREGSAAYKMYEAIKDMKTVGAARAKVMKAKLEKRDGHFPVMLRVWADKGTLKVSA
jgi:hypothetical protein